MTNNNNSNNFKVLVEINGYKYSVIINNAINENQITFNYVLNETKLQTKQNISHESHLFQIYDKDFEEYVLITNDKQIIENKSRIKVLLKLNTSINSNENYEVLSHYSIENSIKYSSNSTLNEVSDIESLIDLNSNSINTNVNKMRAFSPFNCCQNSETSSFATKPKVIINNNIIEKLLQKTQINDNSSIEPTVNAFKPEIDVKSSLRAFSPFNSSQNSESPGFSLKSKPIINTIKEEVLKTPQVINNSSIKTQFKSIKPEFNVKPIHSSTETMTSKTKPNNYFNPKIEKSGGNENCCQLSYETITIKLENKPTIALKFSSDEMKAYEQLINLMKIYINSCNLLMRENDWNFISNEMIRNGYRKWISKKCMDSFIGSINLYKQILENAPNYETASAVYPLFVLIHSLDLKYLINRNNFEIVSKLRDLFAIKNNKQNKTISLNSKSEKHMINANKTSVISLTTRTSKIGQKYENLKSQLLMELKSINNSDIQLFKATVQTMDSIIRQYGSEVKDKWVLVSDELKAKGYPNLSESAYKCESRFINHVCDYYKKTLMISDDYKTASSIYPLFDLIYKLDLKPFLSVKSFDKINKFRQQFHLRIGSTQMGANNEQQLNRCQPQKQLSVNNSFDSNRELYYGLKDLNLEENQDSESLQDYYQEKPLYIENWRLQTIVDFKLSETPKRYVIIVTVKYDNSFNILPKKSTDLSVIKLRFVKLSPEDIEIFQLITKFINDNKDYFLSGHKSEDKWMRVSHQMIDIGYNEFTYIKCKEFFQTLKSIYIQLLQYTPNIKTASDIFPLFKTFNSMDLKHLSQELTFNKIMILRDRIEFQSN